MGSKGDEGFPWWIILAIGYWLMVLVGVALVAMLLVYFVGYLIAGALMLVGVV